MQAEPVEQSKLRLGLSALPFFISHLVCFAAIWTGVTKEALILCVVLLFVRTFGVTGGYHRYFSHRTFKTSRVFQFILAFLAQTSAQKGVLWWAAHHRVHHKHSDLPGDVHSPVQRGFWYAHVGWILDDTAETRWDRIRDFAKYPELRFLNKYYLIPPIMLGAACYWIAGWSGLVVGFFWSTTLLWHNTFIINSLTHIWGKRRFETSDASRNNLLTALLTLGEGWHNNHHHYQSSARNGFYWWEIDITYYIIRLLGFLGIVWDIRPVPDHVLEAGRKADRERKEKRLTLSSPNA